MQTIMVSLGKNGRLVVPAPFRHSLGIKAGDELVVTLADGELRITTREHAVARAQQAVRRRVDRDASLAAELIEERRAEAST
ncbi:MAG: AbrB/MazE/SpoVT family DNA-binding domain-containing protein [Acidobacteriota bacterium]|jgi:AbrB family looped-hinge helix DNA binding protein